MTHLVATNAKLDERAVQVLMSATGAQEGDCREALAQSDGALPVALTAMLSGADAAVADEVLAEGVSIRVAGRALCHCAQHDGRWLSRMLPHAAPLGMPIHSSRGLLPTAAARGNGSIFRRRSEPFHPMEQFVLSKIHPPRILRTR